MIFYKFFLKTTRRFFVKFGQITPFRQIGYALYFIALKLSVWYLLVKDKNIKSIYLYSPYNRWFYPGVSDFDIYVVFKKSSSEKEFGVIQKYQKEYNLIKSFFPFLWSGGSPFFEEDFIFWEYENNLFLVESERIKKLRLIAGQELRKTGEKKAIGQMVYFTNRLFYEEALTNIYDCVINGYPSLRNFFKHSKNLIFNSFLADPEKQPDLSVPDWLAKVGCEEKFWSRFNELEQKKYVYDENLVLDIVYNLNKIFAYHGRLSKNVKGEQKIPIVNANKNFSYPESINRFVDNLNQTENFFSITLTKAYLENLNAFFLYLVLSDEPAKFKEQLRDIFRSLPLITELKEKIHIQQRGHLFFFPNITFPFILSSEATSFWQFINAGALYESLNLNQNSINLRGQPLAVKFFDSEVKNSFYTLVRINLAPISLGTLTMMSVMMMREDLFRKTGRLILTGVSDSYQKEFGEKVNFQDYQSTYVWFRNKFKQKYPEQLKILDQISKHRRI